MWKNVRKDGNKKREWRQVWGKLEKTETGTRKSSRRRGRGGQSTKQHRRGVGRALWDESGDHKLL
jgi:hypothetical protein